MAGSRKLSIEIVGDAKGVAGAFSEVEGAADGMDKKTAFSFKGFKASLEGAEGATGKFSAGMGFAKEHATDLAMAGGEAIAKFAVKALDAFLGTAKAAKDLGTETGLTTEQGSRWIAIADDMGVSAESISGAFGKVIKNLDKKAWQDYGIATHDAGGQIRPTNEIMLDAFDALSKIPEGAERAKAGNDLFGKSYADLSPLIGKNREEIEKNLAAVEKGQVITDKESATAERMRKAQDALKDAIQEVTLAVGQMVAKMAPFIEMAAKSIGKLIEWNDALNDTSTTIGKVSTLLQVTTNPIGKFGDAWDVATGQANAVTYAIADNLIPAVVKTGEELKIAAKEAENAAPHWWELGDRIEDTGTKSVITSAAQDMLAGALLRQQGVLGDAKEGFEQAITVHGRFAASLDGATASTGVMDAAYQTLMGHLDAEDAWVKAQQAIDLFHWKQADGSSAAEQQQQFRDTKRVLGEYVHDLVGVPDEKKTELYALLDQGNIAAVQRELDLLAWERIVRMKVELTSIIDIGKIGGKGFASGTASAPAGWAWTGEHGRELVKFAGGEPVLTAGESNTFAARNGAGRSSGGIIVNVNVQGSVSTERDLVRSIYDGIIDGQARGELVGSLG